MSTPLFLGSWVRMQPENRVSAVCFRTHFLPIKKPNPRQDESSANIHAVNLSFSSYLLAFLFLSFLNFLFILSTTTFSSSCGFLHLSCFLAQWLKGPNTSSEKNRYTKRERKRERDTHTHWNDKHWDTKTRHLRFSESSHSKHSSLCGSLKALNLPPFRRAKTCSWLPALY